jgi:glycosyltransferase involved in cell wall biosynthesis
MKHIVHISTAHSRFDIRIFHKEVQATAQHYKASLIIADNLGDELKDGIKIYDIGKYSKRWKRMFLSIFRMYSAVKKIDADIVHFHDPEILMIVLPLKWFTGKKIIYDVHENVHKQILSKKYIPFFLRYTVSKLFYYYENLVCYYLDAILTATPSIATRFELFGNKVTVVNNFPIQNELLVNEQGKETKNNEIAYAGNISIERGIIELVEAMGILKGKYILNLAGSFESQELLQVAKEMDGWKYINYFGLVNRIELSKIFNRSQAGIVNFLPAPNHIESQPNKMYEYMSAGMPVLCSNFDVWKEMVDKFKIGVTFDPCSPVDLSNAIDSLLQDEVKCKLYGCNARNAVLNHFNWEVEKLKLIQVYKNILN